MTVSLITWSSIEKAKFEQFTADYKKGKYKGQRLGQAFYNEFSLHKVADQVALGNLYELDGTKAVAFINKLFTFS